MMNMQKMKPLVQRYVMEQLEKEKAKMRTEITTAMMATTLITLHDKYNWQPNQLVKIMNEIFDQFEAVWEKYVKIEDFYAWLESVGIKVK